MFRSTFRRGLLAAFVLLALVAAGCSGDDEPDEPVGSEEPSGPTGTLRYGFGAENQGFDPLLAADVNSGVYRQPVYEGLLRQLPPENELEAGLATEWEVRDADGDGTQDTISVTLREGVTFSDGEVWDAEALKANLSRPSPPSAIVRPGEPVFSEVVVIDATHADIVYDKVTFALLTQFADGDMISPKAIADPSIDLNTTPVGTGPWVYDAGASTAGVEYTYNAREGYWDPEAQQVETIVILTLTGDAALNALRAGEIDAASLNANTGFQAESAGFGVATSSTSWNGLLILDQTGAQVEALGDVKVRQAMAYALDREEYVDALLFGFGAPSAQPYGEGSEGYAPELDEAFGYDLDRAKELMAEAGYADGFSFTAAAISGSSDGPQAIAGFLAEIGIDMELRLISGSELTSTLESGEVQAFAANLPQSGPADLYSLLLDPEGLFNPSKADPSAEVRSTNDQLAAAFEPAERNELAASMTTAMVENVNVLVVATSGEVLGYDDDSVSEVYVRAGTTAIDFRGVRVSS